MTITNDTQPQVRVTGSNYTTFRFGGKTLAYLQIVADSGQRAFGGTGGQGYEFIHPLGSRTPTEIAVSRVLGGGTLLLTFVETWNAAVWEQLPGLAGTTDIVEIFERLSRTPQYMTATKIITTPSGTRRGKTYHRVTIVDIDDGETITVGGMSIPKTVLVAYTHTTKIGR